MPTFAKGQKSAIKKLGFTPPLYTRSQGQCSTQIKHFYWCEKLKSAWFLLYSNDVMHKFNQIIKTHIKLIF
jgi:hypothetical protein